MSNFAEVVLPPGPTPAHFYSTEAIEISVEPSRYAAKTEDVNPGFEGIIGSSSTLREVLDQVRTVAPTDSTVVIEGETGTGKELIARAIHAHSRRRNQPLVKLNCAAIPLDLLESELFGHEKGAFTGAVARRTGRFEAADRGTLFLDEIGDIPLPLQAKLLRVLQEREFERLGSSRTQRVDVRVVAATHRDLTRMVSEKSFRRDLYYRLYVFPIEIPPLRERREDIPLLVEYFVDRYASNAGKKIRGINKRTMEMLQSYAWPGNVRELQNVIERSVIVCETENFALDETWAFSGTGSGLASKPAALRRACEA